MANAYKEEQQRKRDEALMATCKNLISAGKLIEAIRAYRAATGCGLEPAQRALGLRGIAMSSDLVLVPREKLNDLIGAVRSINRGKTHEIRLLGDDEPCYWQRKEWVEWALSVCEDLAGEVARLNDESAPLQASKS